MKNLNFKKLLPCVAIIATLFFSPVSLANETETETMTQAEALAIDAKHYAAAYGVDETEAMRRLLIMHGSTEEIEALEKTYQDRLAGVYFDNGANFGLNFVLTGDETPQERKLIRKAQKAERKAEKQAAKEEKKAAKQQAKDEKKQQKHYAKWGITEADVNKAISMIEQPTETKVKFRAKAKDKQVNQISKLEKNFYKLKQQITGLVDIYFDVKDEKFVVEVNTKEAKAANLTLDKVTQIATAVLNSPVKVKFSDIQIMNTDLRGGSIITGTNLQGNTGICTTAFTAKNRTTGEMGVLTAGHCEFPTATYIDKDGTQYTMKRAKELQTEKADIAFYVPVSKQNVKFSPTFYPDGGNAKPRNLTGFVSVKNTNVRKNVLSVNIKEGSFVCTYGHKTNAQSCGEVTSVNASPAYPRGCGVNRNDPNASIVNCGPYFVKVEPKVKVGQPNLQCAGGDSGGPWFAYGNAYGIQSGSGFMPDGTCAFSYYTPIQVINDMDLTLYYYGK